MTNEELKDALCKGYPVEADAPHCGTILYKRVSAVIYKIIDRQLVVCAELESMVGRSRTIVRGTMVHLPEQTDTEGGADV